MMSYNIWLLRPDGERLAILDSFLRLSYRRVLNDTGHYRADGVRNRPPLSLRLPYSAGVLRLFERDSRLEIWRNGRLETETVWLVQNIAVVLSEDQQRIIEIGAVPALALLGWRIVAYAAGSPQASKSGPADDLMKALVAENLGGSASDPQRNSNDWLTIAPDLGAAPTVALTCPRQTLLEAMHKLAALSAAAGTRLYFDVVGTTPDLLEFRSYTSARGIDHTTPDGINPLVFSAATDTLRSAERSFEYEDEITLVYAAGQGAEGERLLAESGDEARIRSSPFGRRERLLDARSIGDDVRLAAAASAALAAGQPRRTFRAEIRNRPGMAYGVHWSWGDRVMAEVDNEVLPCNISELRVTVANSADRQYETIRAWLSAEDIASGPDTLHLALPETEQTYQQVQRGWLAGESSLVIPADGHLLVYGRYEIVGGLTIAAGGRLVVLV